MDKAGQSHKDVDYCGRDIAGGDCFTTFSIA
jgi:hypothetical protein